MITKDAFLPRNKDIKDNEDHENEVMAAQKNQDEERAHKIDELAKLNGKKKSKPPEEKEEAKSLNEFIEIIIRMPKK